MAVLPMAERPAPSAKMQELMQCFAEVAQEFAASQPMQYFASGKYTVEHYKEYLRQVYFYTRESTQLLACFAAALRGSDRNLVGGLLKHAREEWGHDQWALQDLSNLGADISNIPYENPLPETLALNAFTFYQIEHRNPIGHLGYVFFLEFLPTGSGGKYSKMLEAMGVPSNAMSFIQEHITVDAYHNKLMERYAEELIHDDADMEAVKYSMRITCKLYINMLTAAIEQVSKPKDWGTCHDELRRKVGDGTLYYEPDEEKK